MRLIVKKGWHKLALIVIMGYFSVLMTTIFLPMVWIYFETPTLKFFINSFFLIFLGGAIFNIIFSIRYNTNKSELTKGISRGFVIRVFVFKLIVYSLLVSIVALLTDNIIPYVYISLFLFIGGYGWYCILRAYVKVKNDYENNIDPKKYSLWLDIFLYLGIALSLLLGYMHRFF